MLMLMCMINEVYKLEICTEEMCAIYETALMKYMVIECEMKLCITLGDFIIEYYFFQF
jgi:hypothetical protein